MMINDTNGLGRISVRTLELPGFVKQPSGTYTCSGKVLVDYKREGDTQKDYIRLGVTNDDGTEFREIFAGVIPTHGKANGIRFMPFMDNKRVLLGDYVLECTPDIDTCEKAEVIPVAYPWGLQEDHRIFKSWSEVIISQDNAHICWTVLLSDGGAAVAIGRLEREIGQYVIQGAQVISSAEEYEKNPEHDGYMIPKRRLGGEVKQFARGGAAITLVGAGDGALPDSVVQDLRTGDMMQITRAPGYEETTILSPDERLGIVMSTRFSEKTNLAILGLLPRPHASLVTMGLSLYVYMYAVAAVRHHKPGNIGPVIIDVRKSMSEPGYMGAPLHDPEGKWVYLSPMSWHPSGQRAMWPEMRRGDYANKRIRIAELLDYEPSEPVPAQSTPDMIPYGKPGEVVFRNAENDVDLKIAGKRCGFIAYERKAAGSLMRYEHYSDDGTVFYDGFERLDFSGGGAVYEADVDMTGGKTGEMKCRLAFSKGGHSIMPDLLFDAAEDGLPKTRGYARLGVHQINVDVMRALE